MKYIIRLIALPFYACVWLVFSIYITTRNLFRLCYDFIVYGGELIVYDKEINKDSIMRVYLKLEQMELNLKVDPRSQCNHVWEQEVGYGQTTAPRKKCVICGVQLNTNHFTK
jgi:hypothetical protein